MKTARLFGLAVFFSRVFFAKSLRAGSSLFALGEDKRECIMNRARLSYVVHLVFKGRYFITYLCARLVRRAARVHLNLKDTRAVCWSDYIGLMGC